MLVVTGGWLSMWSGASFQNTTHSSTGTRAAVLIPADYPTSVLSPSAPPRSLSRSLWRSPQAYLWPTPADHKSLSPTVRFLCSAPFCAFTLCCHLFLTGCWKSFPNLLHAFLSLALFSNPAHQHTNTLLTPNCQKDYMSHNWITAHMCVM